MKQLLDISQQYYDETDLEYRKKHGQYFTPENLKSKALDLINIEDGSRVLENSCGSGEFIKSIFEKNRSKVGGSR